MADRIFYGGAAPSGLLGGELSVGHYDGPEAHVLAPWRCPACGVENGGRLELGCVSCGAGTPGRHVGVQPPAHAAAPDLYDRFFGPTAQSSTLERSKSIYPVAEAWADAHPAASLAAAFIAGYLTATEVELPPMRRPAESGMGNALAPEGKARRTLLAALELFVDQILRQQPEEIVSGEWCSVEEAEALAESLRREEQLSIERQEDR